MKILHVNNNVSGGGVEQYLNQLIPALNRNGHFNAVLLGRARDGQKISRDLDSICIDKIADKHCPEEKHKLAEVRNIVDQLNPDLIYMHQVFNFRLTELLTSMRPTIKFFHDYKLVCPDGAKTLKSIGQACTNPIGAGCQLRAYRYRCMPRNPFVGLRLIKTSKKILEIHKRRSHIVVASSFVKLELVRNGFDENKISKIPYFTNFTDLPDNRPDSESSTVLAIGRLVEVKGMHQLLMAFSKVKKKSKLAIVGDGPELRNLKRLTKRLGLCHRVTFHGWLAHDQVAKILTECSLVVVPSIWPEPFGIVGIEAMAFQKPVVAFDVGGIPEWLNDGESGILVENRDEEGLTEKIDYILGNPDIADQLGSEGARIVKTRFLPATHMRALEEVFTEVTK